jgi:hypothetical protein
VIIFLYAEEEYDNFINIPFKIKIDGYLNVENFSCVVLPMIKELLNEGLIKVKKGYIT